MLEQTVVEKVIVAAGKGDADFAELYVERWKRKNIRVLNRELQEANSGIEYGAGLRLFYGTEVVYAYTNDLDEASLLDLAQTMIKLKGKSGQVDAMGKGGLDFRRQIAKGIHQPEKPFDTQSKKYRFERLLETEAAVRIDTQIKQVQCHFLEWEQDILVANSEGIWNEDRRVRSRLTVNAIAENDSGAQTGFKSIGFSRGLELFDLATPEELGRAAAQQALTNLSAKPAPAGTMPAVIGNGFGGVLFHEALGHLLETTAVAKNASVLANKVGEQVASPTVTYVDEGLSKHGWGSSEFDDEGMATERTTLIEKGVLKSYMVDRLGSLQTGYQPTGSGRRQDYTFAPTSRMRNTFIEKGETPKEDLFKDIELGIYAKDMGGGQVRPGSGEYNFGVKEAYMIRNGQIEEPVRGAMLLGKGPETVQKIEAVSDDLDIGPGMCGSLSGSVPAGCGQPHVLVSEIVVGGEA